MAGNVRIIAHITNIAHSSGETDLVAEFLIDYFISGVGGAGLTGPTFGQMVLTVDVTTNETQLVKAIQTAVAAYLDPLISPAQGFTFNDVHGCNI